MKREEQIQVMLELNGHAGDVLSGRIGVFGQLVEFSGWLSLIAALEDARRPPEDGARSPPVRRAPSAFLTRKDANTRSPALRPAGDAAQDAGNSENEPDAGWFRC